MRTLLGEGISQRDVKKYDYDGNYTKKENWENPDRDGEKRWII